MLPFRCALCHSYQTTSAVCAPCLADIEELRTSDACRWCAAPNAAPVCGACLRRPPKFDGATAAFAYKQPLAALICAFKYGKHWQLAKQLARLSPPPPTVDLVAPVPLHPKRERQRGFNQARELTRRMRLSAANDVVLRVIDTPPQAGMTDADSRRKNIRGAFRVVGDVGGLSVLIVDDVMTTGATLNEVAQALKKSGAASVRAFVVARAIV